LGETLEEEKNADMLLTQVAEGGSGSLGGSSQSKAKASSNS
jgi:hypothetical protein